MVNKHKADVQQEAKIVFISTWNFQVELVMVIMMNAVITVIWILESKAMFLIA